MAIPPEVEADILRYHHVEKWRVGTIARQLGIHHTTVTRVLIQAGVPQTGLVRRRSIADPYLPFIQELLQRFPTLPASRVFEMVRERGYTGVSQGHFRRIVARLRPRKPAEAFLRLRTLPGEEAQVDWGHFGKLQVGRASRPLMAFVMVLSWSRRIALRFFLGHRMGDFLRGHIHAFETFGGVPRHLLYDNLKSAVLERRRDAIRFHPTLLSLAAHYRFEARPVGIARGNEKGRVERAIRGIRDSFYAAREWRDLDDLNAQAKAWCEGLSSDRPWPDDRSRSVGEAFAEERDRLIPLPDNPFEAEDRVEVRVGKTPYARFDLNDYSVPHTCVRRSLTLRATEDEVRVLDGAEIVARHPRSYDRGAQIENPAHIEALLAMKRQAREHRGKDRLHHACPRSEALFIAAAERGGNLGGVTSALLRLLDQYGAAELDAAVAEALARGVPHPHAVRQSLERRREERAQPPALPLSLGDDPRINEVVVRPHALADYDCLEDDDES